MQVIDPTEIMKGFRRVDCSTARSVELRGVLDDIRRVRARLDGVEAEVARLLESATGTPERDIAKGAQRSNRHGAKVVARAAALASTPVLAEALDAGDLGGDHVDMAAMFATKTPSTAPTDPGEKQDHLRALALLALTKGVVGSNAPPAGSKARPQGPTEPEPTHLGPTDQPTSPDEWDAFAAEVGTTSTRFGRPECIVVIDTTNLGPDGNPTVDWGIPVTIPWARVQDLCTNAAIRPVIVRDTAVIDADGELNLGRTTRLANRAQRRALRAIHATCAVPGCTSAFDTPSHTTSTGGATTDRPTSPTSSRCAASIITALTKADGSSPSDPTANSPSNSRTATSCERDHPAEDRPPREP